MSRLSHVLIWNTHAINSTEVKSVVGDFIGRTVINLQVIFHMIHDHLSAARN
jgi:hypothetical protein